MRRYAYEGSLADLPLEQFDVVIEGSGIAGMYCALNLDPALKVALLNKSGIDVSNSWYAQGGIAAAIELDDNPEDHYADTQEAGAHLCDEAAVRVLVREGPGDIQALVDMGVPFDREPDGPLHTTREGAHRRNRIVHCGGDATGFGVSSRLAELVQGRPNITVRNQCCMVDVLGGDTGAVEGVLVWEDGQLKVLCAPAVVIASGGIGRIYRNSTNARSATGDGVAAARRAGAQLRDMEFVQFHPTALIHPGSDGRFFLISEALRGEGAVLRNRRWERFMQGVHPLADLAPRDVVTRAIIAEMRRWDLPHVYLDITARPRSFLSSRFPTIYEECMSRGIDIAKDWIPVIPVQHYTMGGIHTDTEARTTVAGLYACGEAACTGVHGANRLASNSLLECLVYGRRAAQSVMATAHRRPSVPERTGDALERPACGDLDALRTEIRALMTRKGGIIRNQGSMGEALGRIDELLTMLGDAAFTGVKWLETWNMAQCAREVLVAAMARHKSVGAHFRDDEEDLVVSTS